MKRKPDILVVLAAILGLGIVASSVNGSMEVDPAKAETQVAQVGQSLK